MFIYVYILGREPFIYMCIQAYIMYCLLRILYMHRTILTLRYTNEPHTTLIYFKHPTLKELKLSWTGEGVADSLKQGNRPSYCLNYTLFFLLFKFENK